MQQPRTIRIFISSTFKDMHSERDYLVKYIFPELREKCIKKGLSLVDVDLRWGVTVEEVEQGKAIEICLDEIENCRPFFIGILGERYGWIPNNYELPNYQQYDWLKKFEKGHSVTALEIYHGVLNRKMMHPRAFFYFRNSGFVNDIPKAKQQDILVESAESAEKLVRLKENIKDAFSVCQIPGHITENYPCQYRGLKIDWPSVKKSIANQLNNENITILEKFAGSDYLIDNNEYIGLNEKQRIIVDQYSSVCLNGLEDFGNEVLSDLWKAINEEYPDEHIEINPILIEKKIHDQFMNSRTRMFIGREDITREIFTYLRDSDNRKPIIITGEPGSGKSAVMAFAAKQNMASNNYGYTIIRFIGGSSESLNINKLVKGIIREIAFKFELTIDESRIEDQSELYEYLRAILFSAGKLGKLTIFIDALNQLKPFSNPQYLIWLPKYLPDNIKIILSSVEGDYTENAKKYELSLLMVEKLSFKQCYDILHIILGEYRKTLTKNQVESILVKSDTTKPLYLKVACEELRVFPNHDLIDSRINNLPDTIPELFSQMIERLESDHTQRFVQDTMCLIECSIYGLLESELLELLKPVDQVRLPLNTWSRLYRSLATYLTNVGTDREGLLDFFHQQLSYAVKTKYLRVKEVEMYYYKKLADYGLGEFNLKNGNLTNTVLFTGIYTYNANEEELLHELLKDIFTRGKENYDVYKGIAFELCNWVIETYSFDSENIFKNLIEEIANNNKPHLLALFLNENGQSFEETGNLNWALYFFEHALQIMTFLVEHQQDDLDLKNNLAECYSNVGNIYSKIGEGFKSNEVFEKQKNILEELVVLNPDRTNFKRELSVSFMNLGDYYSSTGDTKNALVYFEKDLQIMEGLITKEPNRSDYKSDLTVSLKNLGDLYNSIGKGQKALNFYNKDLLLMEELVLHEPHSADFKRDLSISYKNLGDYYSSIGKGKKALGFFEKDLQLMEELIMLDPVRTDFKRDLTVSYKNLGDFYSSIGDDKQALFFFEKDLLFMQELVFLEPDRTDFKRDLSVSYKNLGDLYCSLGKGPDALAFYEKDLHIMEELILIEPDRTDFHRDLTVSYKNLGDYYNSIGEGQKALSFFEKDLKLMEELVFHQRDRTDFKSDLAVSYKNIGDYYSSIGDQKKALEFFEKDLSIMEELIFLEPDKIDFKRDLSVSFSNIGNAYSDLGEENVALEFFKKDLQLMKELILLEPDRTDFKRDLLVTFSNLGIFFLKIGNNQLAFKYFEKQKVTLEGLIILKLDSVDLIIDYKECIMHCTQVCPNRQKSNWLRETTSFIKPIISNGFQNPQLQELWVKVAITIKNFNDN